jgi:hypothetical protein
MMRMPKILPAVLGGGCGIFVVVKMAVPGEGAGYFLSGVIGGASL